MALIGESACESDFRQRSRCHPHQILGAIDAALHQPTVRWDPRAAREGFCEVADGQPAIAGHPRQRYPSVEVSIHRVSGKP
jgi:hypothetical protein